jgi:hypothetical protein
MGRLLALATALWVLGSGLGCGAAAGADPVLNDEENKNPVLIEDFEIPECWQLWTGHYCTMGSTPLFEWVQDQPHSGAYCGKAVVAPGGEVQIITRADTSGFRENGGKPGIKLPSAVEEISVWVSPTSAA